jgi:hypothetical protein
MSRLLLLQLLLIALPFIVYFAAMWIGRRTVGRGARPAVPWFALLSSGLALSLAAALAMALGFGGESSGNYVAATVKDGTVVPGHFK